VTGTTERRAPRRTRTALALAFTALAAIPASCSFDSGERWIAAEREAPVVVCKVGDERCNGALEHCVATSDADGGQAWETEDDCESRGQTCVVSLLACANCEPFATRCVGQDVERCAADGSDYEKGATCDTSTGVACRDGACADLCVRAAAQRSNVGCEYWAADLDNADIDDTLNAAAQQFAIVVSNPQPDLPSFVTIEQDDSAPGGDNTPRQVASATVPPLGLSVFRLGPREVDGSPPGKYDSGTNTALTRQAYRIKSTVPIIAYQFNPLENVNVFSNDASLLKPVEALGGDAQLRPAYVVLGWPQTIAITDDPDTNFSTTAPQHLRAFLTLVGTRKETHVRVHTKAAIVAGGPIEKTAVGGTVEFTLQPFDVMNLETGGFLADFTGSIVEADNPIVAFSGSEASDAPAWKKLADRQCCADHLEEQLDPIRTGGKTFIATVSPNRTDALIRAGATAIGHVDMPEFFRIAAVTDAGAVVRTSLPKPDDRLELKALGDFVEVTSTTDFVVDSTEPVALASISASQGAAGVPSRLPGGDPSLLIIPPIEQYRTNYVFLTPDKYSFDFIRIVAPAGALVRLDQALVDDTAGCTRSSLPAFGDVPRFVVYQCQLGFPVIDLNASADGVLSPGVQNDGVHTIDATDPVNVLVDGFDRNVSYAYAAGTDLREIITR
jgi:hypothetical protein